MACEFHTQLKINYLRMKNLSCCNNITYDDSMAYSRKISLGVYGGYDYNMNHFEA